MTDVPNLIFCLRNGVILGDQIWSETKVSGNGGGLMVNGIGVASSRTRSTITNKREIWIRFDDGTEQSITVIADRVRVRTGQRVTLVYGKVGKQEPIMSLHNHSTNEDIVIHSVGTLLGWEKWAALGALPATFLGAILFFAAGSTVGLFMLLGLGSLFVVRSKYKSIQRRIAETLSTGVCDAPALATPSGS
jgi:hypothetical protein